MSHEILQLHVEKLQEYLKRELEIEQRAACWKRFLRRLSSRFSLKIASIKRLKIFLRYEKIHATVADSLEPFHDQLLRVPTHEDREKLLNIPIRRISRFDLDKNQEEIAAMQATCCKVEKDLKISKKFTI